MCLTCLGTAQFQRRPRERLRSITYSLPWIEAARLDWRNATSSAIPSGDGRHDRLNSELQLRLRNEYASNRVSQRAAALMEPRWLLSRKAAAPADTLDRLSLTLSRRT